MVRDVHLWHVAMPQRLCTCLIILWRHADLLYVLFRLVFGKAALIHIFPLTMHDTMTAYVKVSLIVTTGIHHPTLKLLSVDSTMHFIIF